MASSLYDFSVFGVSFGGDYPRNTFLGSAIFAEDFDASGAALDSDGTAAFTHSIDQHIEGDIHTVLKTVSVPEGKTFATSIPSNLTSWDGTNLSINGLQFDFGNYYQGQWGVEGMGKVDGLNLDLPWKHADSIDTMEFAFADGTKTEVQIVHQDANFPEDVDHTNDDEVYYSPTVHFDDGQNVNGILRTVGDAVSVTFKQAYNVTNEVESNGEVRLYRDGYDIHIQDAAGNWHDVLGNDYLNRILHNEKWELSSAEVVGDANELLFNRTNGKMSKVFLLDENWDVVSAGSLNKGLSHKANEDEHQIDFNADGKVSGSSKYDFQVFLAEADLSPEDESITFVGSTAGANDYSGEGVARDSVGRNRYLHSIEEAHDDDLITISSTVETFDGKPFFKSIKKNERNLKSWDGKDLAINALQFDFGNLYQGQFGLGEVDGVDLDLPWDHEDSSSSYTVTFKDGSTSTINYSQSDEAFNEIDGVTDHDELHMSHLFSLDLPIDVNDPSGKKLGNAVKVTFTEVFDLAQVVESSGSIKTAITDDGGIYVHDEENKWHDVTGVADEIIGHVAEASESFSDYKLAGAEIISGINQLVYSSPKKDKSVLVSLDENWQVIADSAATFDHLSGEVHDKLEDQFGLDFDKDGIVGAINEAWI